jgi:hypothetical protein
MLKDEHLYADMHCHEGTHLEMSAFHASCSEWPYVGLLVFQNTNDPGASISVFYSEAGGCKFLQNIGKYFWIASHARR